jgi:putative addiction module component (TIGR02574 family)
MVRELDEIEREAMALPRGQRAHLAHRLLTTLDDEDEDVDEGLEELWLQEAERRYHEYRQGLVTDEPADKVIEEIRQRFV